MQNLIQPNLVMRIIKANSKLTRDERNAIHGIYNSYKNEAEYYRAENEKLKKQLKRANR